MTKSTQCPGTTADLIGGLILQAETEEEMYKNVDLVLLRLGHTLHPHELERVKAAVQNKKDDFALKLSYAVNHFEKIIGELGKMAKKVA